MLVCLSKLSKALQNLLYNCPCHLKKEKWFFMIFQNMNSLTVIRYTNKDSKHRLYVVLIHTFLCFKIYTTFFRLSSFMKNASKIIDLITILFTLSFHTTFIFYIFHFCKVTTLYGIIRAKYKVLLLLPLS